MSRQLGRIRSLVSEIDQIQRQGRMESISTIAKPPEFQRLPAKSGQVSMNLSSEVTLELKMEGMAEIIEVKKTPHGLQIRFQDGKEFHIPVKSVA